METQNDKPKNSRLNRALGLITLAAGISVFYLVVHKSSQPYPQLKEEPAIAAPIEQHYFSISPDSIQARFKGLGFDLVLDSAKSLGSHYLFIKRDGELTYRLTVLTHANGRVRFMRAEVDSKTQPGLKHPDDFMVTALQGLPGAEELATWVRANYGTEKATTQASGTKVTIDASGPVYLYMIIEPV